MPKFFSPIIYSAFVLPTLLLSIWAISLIENTIGLSRFWRVGFLEAAFVVVVLGGGIFWLANVLIEKIEGSKTRTIVDHLRQSVLCYLAAGWIFLSFLLKGGFQGGLGEAIAFIIGIICLWAAVVNFVYIFGCIIYSKREIPR